MICARCRNTMTQVKPMVIHFTDPPQWDKHLRCPSCGFSVNTGRVIGEPLADALHDKWAEANAWIIANSLINSYMLIC